MSEYVREAYENGQLDPYNQEYIDSTGADAYFEEVYPFLVARSISIDNLRNGMARDDEVPQHSDGRTYWQDFKEKVITAAEISIPETAAHSATLGGVYGFLHDVRQTDRNLIRGLFDGPAAPESHELPTSRGRTGVCRRSRAMLSILGSNDLEMQEHRQEH